MSQLADWLQRQMENNSWSKRRLSEETGVSRAALDNIIDDGATPLFATMAKLAKAFNVPLWHIVDMCGEDLGLPKEGTARARQLDALIQAMPQYEPVISHLLQASPRKLDRILAILEHELRMHPE